MTQYSQSSLETAACLWEAVLSLREQPITNPDALGLALDIRRAFDALGTASLRVTVVGWTEAVDAAWRDVEDEYPLSFDWDFVSGWVIDHVDWSDPMHPNVVQRGGGGSLGAAGNGSPPDRSITHVPSPHQS